MNKHDHVIGTIGAHQGIGELLWSRKAGERRNLRPVLKRKERTCLRLPFVHYLASLYLTLIMSNLLRYLNDSR